MSVWAGSIGDRRAEVYVGSTNGSGVYAVVYDVPFPTGKPPTVQPALIAGAAGRMFRVSASSETGFSVTVDDRTGVTVLGINVLGTAFTAIASQALSVLVVAQN